jgi:hypothetical protein
MRAAPISKIVQAPNSSSKRKPGSDVLGGAMSAPAKLKRPISMR